MQVSSFISSIPHPHFEFLDINNEIVNVAFAGALGGALGVLLYVAISEILYYLND